VIWRWSRGTPGGGKAPFGRPGASGGGFGGGGVLLIHFEDPPDVVMDRIALHVQGLLVAAAKQAIAGQTPWLSLSREETEVFGNRENIFSANDLRLNVMPDRKRHAVEMVSRRIASLLGGLELFHANGMSMAAAMAVAEARAQVGALEGNPLKRVVVDYLNKAELSPQVIRDWGVAGARAQDAERVKQFAERWNLVAVVIQQENDSGDPFDTRQALHKSQLYLQLVRQDTNGSYQLQVLKANWGQVGAKVNLQLLPTFMTFRVE
ncbi:MAG: hypothetical protein ACK4WK_09315, partial [Anaerolineae bacterium]